MGYTPHVLVIGGGVLGTGIARDLAIRGFEVTLVEQGTLTAGASGRLQGVLYSGARFASRDPSGAKRCHRESRVLRRIADQYVREMGGVIVASPDGESDLDEVLAAAEECEIKAVELTGEQLHDQTDVLSGEIDRGAKVGDAAVDPFLLTVANARGAEDYGAEIETGAEVTELRFEGGRIAGASVRYADEAGKQRPQPGDRSGVEGPELDEESTADEPNTGEGSDDDGGDSDNESNAPEPVGEIQRSFPGATEDSGPDPGSTEEIDADFVVNATGAWADRIAAMAGIDLSLSRQRGTMAVLDGEHAESVVSTTGNRQLTPFWGNTVLGTVSEPFAESGDVAGAMEELIADASALFDVEDTEVLRSYTGLRTTHPGSGSPPEGPGATIVDHKRHHDKWGMLTVVGGTLTTHRAVAESVVDRICSEFGIRRQCRTDQISLPVIDPGKSNMSGMATSAALSAKKAVTGVTSRGEGADPILCEDREIRRSAVQNVLDDQSSSGMDLTDVRLRTGATMGACQGGRCAHRLATQLYPDHDADTVEQSLEAYLRRRWAGRRQTLWNDQLAGAMADYELHARTLHRDGSEPDDLGAFADRTDDDTERRRPTCCEAVRS